MSDARTIPEAKRRAAVQLRRGGANYDEIATTLAVSKGWLTGFFRTLDASPNAPQPDPAAETPQPPVDASAGVAPASGGLEGDIASLEGDLRQLHALAKKPDLDASERVRVSGQISQTTARLAMLRKDLRAVQAPAKDVGVLRGGHAAADLLRKLVEEAIGESVEGVETVTAGGAS